MHAPCVFSDVATDRTGNLRGRIRRVVQAKRRRCLGNGQVAHPGLNPSSAGVGVDMKDFVETRHYQQHAFFQWQCPPGQTRAGPACDHRHAQLMADAQYALHLVQMAGQHHQQRCGAIGAKPVAFVWLEFFTLMQDFKVRQACVQGAQ